MIIIKLLLKIASKSRYLFLTYYSLLFEGYFSKNCNKKIYKVDTQSNCLNID